MIAMTTDKNMNTNNMTAGPNHKGKNIQNQGQLITSDNFKTRKITDKIIPPEIIEPMICSNRFNIVLFRCLDINI